MNNYFYYSILAVSVLTSSIVYCAPPSRAYALQWEENFSDPAAYASCWAFRAPGYRDGYLNTPDMVALDIKDGLLAIKTEFDHPNKAGMVSTQGRCLFTYGYFEAKITLPRKVGNHIGFWLKSEDYDKGGPPTLNGAEVDAIEYLPRTPTTAYFNVHAYGYGSAHRFVGSKVVDAVCAGCTHIFGLEWTPEGYGFFVDGKLAWRTSEFISNVPLYVILSSHTSAWAGVPERIPDHDVVKFHYVRYYQR